MHVAPAVGATIAIAALVLLATAPLVIGRRLATVRDQLVLAPEHARAATRDATRDAVLATLIESARSSPAGGIDQTSGNRERLTTLIRAAAASDARLAATVHAGRARIVALERLSTWFSVTLVPIALLAVLAIVWAARRMARLTDEAECARVALTRSAEARVALLRGLTHDLKNSLWAAGGYANILREELVGPLTTPQRDHVERMERLIHTSMHMVGNTLEIARADAGLLAVHRRPTDLRGILAAAAADYRGVIDTAGLTLRLDADDALPVDTDETHVSAIVANLLSNAVKYTPRGGTVHLRGAHGLRDAGGGSWVIVAVADTGPGIPAEYHERIFDEFFRTPTAQSTASGAGVGLAMSRRVARLLGGDIHVASAVGQGSEFSLWLPTERAGGPVAGGAMDVQTTRRLGRATR